ncbi:hypothetical protein J2S53_001380 [Actinopolyspora lacussalsi]|nr:hypothetical protein [Actinopolyspora lacussalsi]
MSCSMVTPRYAVLVPVGTLHEFRHSALPRLGGQGASLLLLIAKSRHENPENIRRYFKPSERAFVEVTSLLAPDNRQR